MILKVTPKIRTLKFARLHDLNKNSLNVIFNFKTGVYVTNELAAFGSMQNTYCAYCQGPVPRPNQLGPAHICPQGWTYCDVCWGMWEQLWEGWCDVCIAFAGLSLRATRYSWGGPCIHALIIKKQIYLHRWLHVFNQPVYR